MRAGEVWARGLAFSIEPLSRNKPIEVTVVILADRDDDAQFVAHHGQSIWLPRRRHFFDHHHDCGSIALRRSVSQEPLQRVFPRMANGDGREPGDR